MAALIYLSHFRCTFDRNLYELYKLFVRFLCCCVWATNIWKRRATRPKRCARRKSHRANWRRNNEAAATNRTAQESKTEWKQKLFYFSNLFLAVAPRRAAASRERHTHTERERESESMWARTVAREHSCSDSGSGNKATTKRLLAHTHCRTTHAHIPWSSLCYTGCTWVGKLGAPARGNGTAGVCRAQREKRVYDECCGRSEMLPQQGSFNFSITIVLRATWKCCQAVQCKQCVIKMLKNGKISAFQLQIAGKRIMTLRCGFL